jgi:hypothetical protein
MINIASALEQLLIKLIAYNGTPLPPESYLNFTSGSGVPVDNPTFAVNGQVVGATDVPLGGGGGGGTNPFDIAVTTAGGVSASSMAAGRAWMLVMKITTSFSAGATAAVGYLGTPNAMLAGIDLTAAPGTYAYMSLVNWPGAAPVLVTVSGAPSVGAAEFLVFGGGVST